MNNSERRQQIVALARQWIGTPYRHQASMRGVGCDCLGLVRGIWRELYDAEPEDPGAYTSAWAEFDGSERLLNAARRHFVTVPLSDHMPGDVLLFRMRRRAVAKHLAIVSQPDRMIHAYDGTHVIETNLTPYWINKAVAAFSFPESVSD